MFSFSLARNRCTVIGKIPPSGDDATGALRPLNDILFYCMPQSALRADDIRPYRAAPPRLYRADCGVRQGSPVQGELSAKLTEGLEAEGAAVRHRKFETSSRQPLRHAVPASHLPLHKGGFGASFCFTALLRRDGDIPPYVSPSGRAAHSKQKNTPKSAC